MDRFFPEFACVARSGLFRLALLRHASTSSGVLVTYGIWRCQPTSVTVEMDISPRESILHFLNEAQQYGKIAALIVQYHINLFFYSSSHIHQKCHLRSRVAAYKG